MENPARGLWRRTPRGPNPFFGKEMVYYFLFGVCGCSGDWQMDNFIEKTVAALRAQIGDKKVILGLSGGVDSSVAAGLLSRAVGKQLTCVFVDQGLMRKDEGDFVEKTFTSLFDMNFVRVNCQERFFAGTEGRHRPGAKSARSSAPSSLMCFGTRSATRMSWATLPRAPFIRTALSPARGDADTIKTHHNKVKMPEDVQFLGLVEPLCDLFKDEVRKVGTMLGIPKELVWRQPFPGPGLGVRILGEITADKIKVLQEADWVLRDEMAKNGYEKEMAQFFCVLPCVKTVGVMGDHRTYDHLVAIRAVTTDDFMTADWARIPYDILATVSNRITNEVEHVNRVVYDITSKPPGTVEWE